VDAKLERRMNRLDCAPARWKLESRLTRIAWYHHDAPMQPNRICGQDRSLILAAPTASVLDINVVVLFNGFCLARFEL